MTDKPVGGTNSRKRARSPEKRAPPAPFEPGFSATQSAEDVSDLRSTAMGRPSSAVGVPPLPGGAVAAAPTVQSQTYYASPPLPSSGSSSSVPLPVYHPVAQASHVRNMPSITQLSPQSSPNMMTGARVATVVDPITGQPRPQSTHPPLDGRHAPLPMVERSTSMPMPPPSAHQTLPLIGAPLHGAGGRLPPGISQAPHSLSRVLIPAAELAKGDSPTNPFGGITISPGGSLSTNIPLPRISTDVGQQQLYYGWQANEPGLSPATSYMLNQLAPPEQAAAAAAALSNGQAPTSGAILPLPPAQGYSVLPYIHSQSGTGLTPIVGPGLSALLPMPANMKPRPEDAPSRLAVQAASANTGNRGRRADDHPVEPPADSRSTHKRQASRASNRSSVSDHDDAAAAGDKKKRKKGDPSSSRASSKSRASGGKLDSHAASSAAAADGTVAGGATAAIAGEGDDRPAQLMPIRQSSKSRRSVRSRGTTPDGAYVPGATASAAGGRAGRSPSPGRRPTATSHAMGQLHPSTAFTAINAGNAIDAALSGAKAEARDDRPPLSAGQSTGAPLSASILDNFSPITASWLKGAAGVGAGAGAGAGVGEGVGVGAGAGVGDRARSTLAAAESDGGAATADGQRPSVGR